MLTALLDLMSMWSKRSWSKRLWRSYLRSAERMIKLFRIINATFLLGSTAVILVIISLFTPLFSQAVIYLLAHLPLPKMPPAAMISPPSDFIEYGGCLTLNIYKQNILYSHQLYLASKA